MQMRRLDDTVLKAYGKVSRDGFKNYPHCGRHMLELNCEEPTQIYCANSKWIIDYDSGMSLLVIYEQDDVQTKHVFYLDRPVELFSGVHFSIVPFQRQCKVILYTADTLPPKPVGLADNSDGFSYSTSMKLEKLYTFFYQESSNNFFFRGESHDPFELVYVDKGVLHNVINGTDYPLEQGSLIIINSNAWHIQHSANSVCFMTLAFTIKDGALPESAVNRVFVPNTQMKQLIRQMIAERENQELYFHDCLESLLQMLLIQIARHINSSDALTTKPPLPSTERASKDVLDRAINVVTSNISKRLTLEELAAESFVSVSHLIKVFNAQLGMSPGKYINRMRLEECKRMLRETPMQISEVSKRMGYSSVQQFSKQFRHYFDISPTEYLKMIR